MKLNPHMYIHPTCLQVITVHHTSSLATMEGAFMKIIGVMAMTMTVEITVMKKDVVCDARWGETVFLYMCSQNCDIITE